MTESRIKITNCTPVFEINGKDVPPIAYITYFEERNDYKAFSELGYRLFSVTVSFAKQPINTQSGFSPNGNGIFDNRERADFGGVDKSIRLILENCPDAYIFPRVYVCMPQWWIDENQTETIPVGHGKKREGIWSEKFRETAAKMLKELINHINASDYADRIFGYQISGGNTQEWFHLDLRGGHHQNALPYFNKFLEKNHPELAPCVALPNINATFRDGIITDPYLSAFFEFSSESVADTVEHLCKTAKQADDYKKVVGTFYGYTLEVIHSLWGTHKLSKLLDSENIDFFASPNSYAFSRALGEEWGDMMPADSVKLHNKLCFMENDIRTLHSRAPGKVREGSDPYNVYTDAVWQGPPTEELSALALRKSFARQITHKNGMWWFDMFGHWYSSQKLLEEIKKSLEVYSDFERKRADTKVETAVFVDEKMYSKISSKSPMAVCAKRMRDTVSKCGVPYHIYLIEDFKKLQAEGFDYKAVIFANCLDDEAFSDAMSFCAEKGIGYLKFTPEKFIFTPSEYRSFFKESGVWCYLETDDIFYIGNGYFAIHAATDGEKTVNFKEQKDILDLYTKEKFHTDTFKISMEQFETRLFEIK